MKTTWLKAVLLGILLLQPLYGWSQEPEAATEAAVPTWRAPDIIALPDNWWSDFISENSQVFRIRANLLNERINEYVSSLDAENLVSAQTVVNTLRTNLDAALSLQDNPPKLQVATLPILDSYSLQQLLDLRKMWRDGQSQLEILETEQQQYKQRSQLLAQRHDLVLAQYDETDPSSPARLLAGLQRINLQVELYSVQKLLNDNIDQQKQLNDYLVVARQKLNYATDHLNTDSLSIPDLDSSIQGLSNDVSSTTRKLDAIQQKLLDALNADDSDTFQVLNLRQQLTAASAEQMLAQLKLELEHAKRDWLLLRTGAATSTGDLHRKDPVMKAIFNEATQQSALWTHASQNTLITPAPEKDRTAQKAYGEAQASAHRTLDLIDEVNATIDNLTLIQERVTSESLTLTKGFGGAWLRIKLVSRDLWVQSKAILDIGLLHIGETPVTAGGIIQAVVIFLIFWVLSWLIRHFLDGLEKRQNFKQGSFYAGSRVLHYVILTIAAMAALGSLGLEFRNFALIAGALSVGIGFGLQTIVLNFVSGLILLFEGTVRVGDYIELDSTDADVNLMGVVKEIRSRATLINTNDNIDVIVPNSELIGNRMINWTLKESTARMRIPFGVAYGSDKELVKKAALEAAAEGEFVIQHTPGYQPAVRMMKFGDNALHFELRVWVNRQGVRRPMFVRSSILWAMDSKFREYGIRVPFPQRDLHIVEPLVPKRPLEAGPEPAD